MTVSHEGHLGGRMVQAALNETLVTNPGYFYTWRVHIQPTIWISAAHTSQILKPHCPASVQEMTFILTPLNFRHLWFCVHFCVMVKHTLYCLRADLYLSKRPSSVIIFFISMCVCVCVCVISNFCVWWTDDWFMKPLFFWWAQCLWWSPAKECHWESRLIDCWLQLFV